MPFPLHFIICRLFSSRWHLVGHVALLQSFCCFQFFSVILVGSIFAICLILQILLKASQLMFFISSRSLFALFDFQYFFQLRSIDGLFSLHYFLSFSPHQLVWMSMTILNFLVMFMLFYQQEHLFAPPKSSNLFLPKWYPLICLNFHWFSNAANANWINIVTRRSYDVNQVLLAYLPLLASNSPWLSHPSSTLPWWSIELFLQIEFKRTTDEYIPPPSTLHLIHPYMSTGHLVDLERWYSIHCKQPLLLFY